MEKADIYVDLGDSSGRQRGRCWCWEALKDIIWRRDGQNNRRGTGRVLIDQQNLDGTRWTLETNLVFPLAVKDLDKNTYPQSETWASGWKRAKYHRRNLQLLVWGPLVACQWEHGLLGVCHLRRKDRQVMSDGNCIWGCQCVTHRKKRKMSGKILRLNHLWKLHRGLHVLYMP